MGYHRWRVDAAGDDNGKVLLMSDDSPTSFDGRYFGPIPRARIQSVDPERCSAGLDLVTRQKPPRNAA